MTQSLATTFQRFRDRYVAQINMLRNRHAMVNVALPPELLSRIFLFVANLRSGRHKALVASTCWQMLASRSWVRVMRVCRYWREVALMDPQLWGCVVWLGEDAFPGDKKWISRWKRHGGHDISSYVSEWLHRSARGMLDVNLFGVRNFGTFTDELAARCENIKHLRICGCAAGVFAALNENAPNLESLSIKGNTADQELPLLFQGNTPRLRSLILARIKNFPEHNFRQLINLRLRRQHYSTLEDISRLLEVLRSSPSMEELEFELCSAERNSGRLIPQESTPTLYIPLPNLNHLHIWQCNPQFAEGVLRYLHVPTLNLAASCTDEEHPDTMISLFDPDGAASCLRPLLSAPTYEVAFRDKCIRAVSLASGSALNISSTSPFWTEAAFKFMQRTTPFRAVQELWISGQDSIVDSRREWQELFGGLPALSNLVLVSGSEVCASSRDRLRALAPADDIDSTTNYPVPALLSLKCVGEWPVGSFRDVLTPTVAKRDRDGYRLQSLHVSLVGVTLRSDWSEDRLAEGCIEEQRQHVDRVIYDTVAHLPSISLPSACQNCAEYRKSS